MKPFEDPDYMSKIKEKLNDDTDTVLKTSKNNTEKKMRKAVILVADDEAEIRDVIREMFEMDGFTVYDAEDGESAFKIFKEKKSEIDIVIIDIQMPKLNGEKLIKKITYLTKKAKIIVLSSYTKHKISIVPEEYGVSAFLPKPFDLNELRKKVHSLLNDG